MSKTTHNPARLKPFEKKEDKSQVQVVIETPKGCRNKYALNPKTGLFELHKVLPEGMVFPYDFGFIPCTRADDGDPLDVLILMDAPAFPGCCVEVRLIGVFEGQEVEDGKKERNDRLIAVANCSHTHCDLKELSDLNQNLLDEMSKFFENYQRVQGKKFKVIARKGSKVAMRLVKKSELGKKRS